MGLVVQAAPAVLAELEVQAVQAVLAEQVVQAVLEVQADLVAAVAVVDLVDSQTVKVCRPPLALVVEVVLVYQAVMLAQTLACRARTETSRRPELLMLVVLGV